MHLVGHGDDSDVLKAVVVEIGEGEEHGVFTLCADVVDFPRGRCLSQATGVVLEPLAASVKVRSNVLPSVTLSVAVRIPGAPGVKLIDGVKEVPALIVPLGLLIV